MTADSGTRKLGNRHAGATAARLALTALYGYAFPRSVRRLTERRLTRCPLPEPVTDEVPPLARRDEAAPGGTFRALRRRDYRYLWSGQLGHAASVWMEQVARPLLVLHMTGSPLQVGLVIAARTVPQFVFGLLAGVIADRYDKRRVLIWCQTATLLMHLALGLLVVTGRAELWHVFLTAFGAGAANAFNQPARQSLLPRLVPREDLLNALALSSAAANIMRVGGAGLTGVLLIFFDYGEVYLLIALTDAAVIWTTFQIRVPAAVATGGRREGRSASLLSDFAEGFHHVNRDRKVLYLVGMALLLFVLGQPYQQVSVPLLALDVLHLGRSGAGWMLALIGVGALLGSFTVASKGKLPRRGLIMMGLLVVFALALILLSQSRWLPLSAVALLVAGSMSTTYLALNNSLILEQTPPEFHGRVMSLLSLDRGLVSLGAIIAGGLAELWGPQLGLTILAGACLGLTLLAAVAFPVVRRMQ